MLGGSPANPRFRTSGLCQYKLMLIVLRGRWESGERQYAVWFFSNNSYSHIFLFSGFKTNREGKQEALKCQILKCQAFANKPVWKMSHLDSILSLH